MPDSLQTIKNYVFKSSLPFFYDENSLTWIRQVKADGIFTLSKKELFDKYGGERIPNYNNSNNKYKAIVVVFSLDKFLDDNRLKIFHYASELNEHKGNANEYNSLYDEIFTLGSVKKHSEYGYRELNPYHSSLKKLELTTNIFGTTNIKDENSTTPISFELKNNYPNPFNPSTIIEFNINENMFVTIEIINTLGQVVKRLVNNNFNAGNHKINFIAANLSSGVYLYRINAISEISNKLFTQTKKMILLK